MLNIKAPRSIKKNSDIENVLIDTYDKNNIISREKLQSIIKKYLIIQNIPNIAINLFRNKNIFFFF